MNCLPGTGKEALVTAQRWGVSLQEVSADIPGARQPQSVGFSLKGPAGHRDLSSSHREGGCGQRGGT